MKNVKAILFDMDGVIFDTERVYLEEWKQVFKKYGYKMKDEIYISVMGTGRENVKKVFKEYYGDNLPIEDMYVDKDILLNEAVSENKIPLKTGAFDILSYLKDNGYKTALATSAKRDRLEIQLSLADIKDKFDAIVCIDDVGKGKPNPDIFLLAAEKIGVEPSDCMVIEDSEAGIMAAFNAGMIPVHVKDLKEVSETIMKHSKRQFNNLHEIKQYIIENESALSNDKNYLE